MKTNKSESFGYILKDVPIPTYVTLLRLFVPLSILKWPLWGIFAAGILDMYDWVLSNLHTDADYIFYQNWDKAMDLYYWIFAIVVTFSWKDLLAKRFAWLLFIYRVIGDVLFWSTGNRTFLFIFPNIFESFFVFYLLFTLIYKKKKLITSSNVILVLSLVLIVPKLIHEYFMHFLLKQPWEFISIANYLGLTGIIGEYANYFAWGGLLYLIPFLLGLYSVNKLQSQNS